MVWLRVRQCIAPEVQAEQQHEQGSRRPPSTQRSFAAVVAEEAAKMRKRRLLTQGREGQGAGGCRGRGEDREGRQRAEVPDQVTISPA